jgi:tetratricopeptide (TPR) repeat protein
MLGDTPGFAGQFEAAGQEYQRAIETVRQPINAYHNLVMSRKLTEADRPLVEGMRRLLQQGKAQDFSLVILHFTLGKALDDLKEYEAAMGHFDAANRLRHRTSRLDRAALTPQFDGLIERITPDYFARHAALGSGDETPLLVLGMPRSGRTLRYYVANATWARMHRKPHRHPRESGDLCRMGPRFRGDDDPLWRLLHNAGTLTEQIISSHPAVAGGGELRYWLDTGPTWNAGGIRRLTGENARRVAEEYVTMLRDLGPDAARITDKMTANFMWTGLIHTIFPKVRIIHCKRRPIDICLSIYSTYFTARMDFSADRGDLVFFYRQYERLMEHWRSVVPAEIYYETQYEDLVVDPEPRSRELIAFRGLDWDDACLAPERNDRDVRTASVWQARQPVYRTPVARWQRNEPWLGELRKLLPA